MKFFLCFFFLSLALGASAAETVPASESLRNMTADKAVPPSDAQSQVQEAVPAQAAPVSETESSADASLDFLNGFSIGGGGLFVNDFAGGFCDIGFNLVSSANKKVNFRNHVQIGGGADFTGNMQFFARDRFMFGTATPVNEVFTFRHYYVLDFGVAFFSSKTREKQFFALPLLLETRLGAGLDFIVKHRSAFFIESGITFRFLTKGDIHDYVGMKMIGGYISIGRRRLY